MTNKSKPAQLAFEVAALEIGDNFMKAARYFREIQDTMPDKFSYLAKLTGIGLRKAYYLAGIDRKFRNLGIERSRLENIGWTKVRLISDYVNKGNWEELLQLAETSTARELTLKLRKEQTLDGTRCVVLYLTPHEYEVFEEMLLLHGASQVGRGLRDKEEGLINALRTLKGKK
ncbi:hypothetical protein [Hyphomicrobium sp.]|uniref:hypothetical protein n=1 Tax=Hyphomicrobium sp. TaxID=82 RepID=UPI003F6FCAF4